MNFNLSENNKFQIATSSDEPCITGQVLKLLCYVIKEADTKTAQLDGYLARAADTHWATWSCGAD